MQTYLINHTAYERRFSRASAVAKSEARTHRCVASFSSRNRDRRELTLTTDYDIAATTVRHHKPAHTGFIPTAARTEAHRLGLRLGFGLRFGLRLRFWVTLVQLRGERGLWFWSKSRQRGRSSTRNLCQVRLWKALLTDECLWARGVVHTVRVRANRRHHQRRPHDGADRAPRPHIQPLHGRAPNETVKSIATAYRNRKDHTPSSRTSASAQR
jgi:hypothetical protein